MSEFKLDFHDTTVAFADKSDSQLKEKYRLFGMLNSPFLTAIGTRAARFALSIGLPVEGLIKNNLPQRREERKEEIIFAFFASSR